MTGPRRHHRAVADQATLHGLSAKVRNPGLELLECAAPTRADS
jgi:hypothetical protein